MWPPWERVGVRVPRHCMAKLCAKVVPRVSGGATEAIGLDEILEAAQKLGMRYQVDALLREIEQMKILVPALLPVLLLLRGGEAEMQRMAALFGDAVQSAGGCEQVALELHPDVNLQLKEWRVTGFRSCKLLARVKGAKMDQMSEPTD